MSNVDIDLALKDELPQTFTTQDVEDIKSAIDVPRANVNIVPYEVYDYDEVKVGEWRELVDGVKKKKPLYRKVIENVNITLYQNRGWQHIGDTSALNIEKIFFTGIIITSEHNQIPIVYYDGTGSYVTVTYGVSTNNFHIVTGGWGNLSASINIIFEYTKTSDSWQEVVE